jgi:hypothetical protein
LSKDSQDISSVQAELLELIRSDTPEGFEAFYIALINRPLPPHAREWIQAIYDSRGVKRGEETNDGVLIEAFRYSWKTTVLTNVFLAYRIGLEPEKTSLIIQVKDETAEQTARKISDIISTNPVWKWAFPHVVPDEARGWGNKGHYVKRTDMDYGEWLRTCGRDPTFVGYGVTSDSIIGKHPNGVLLVDDIHNELNTASAKELARVISILTGTIFPTINHKETWVVFVGTPWVKNDALGYIKATGTFRSILTPIMRKDEITGEWIPTWPEEYSLAQIERLKKDVGEIEFARMYMCDISAAEGVELKKDWLMEYPNERINPTWEVVFGVDYASLTDPKTPQNRDYFAMAVMRCIPGGGLVLIDGVYERMTQAEAEKRIISFYKLYPTCQIIGFEVLGKGELAYQTLLTSSNVPLVPVTVGNKSKRLRFGKILAPAFQSGRIKITDEPNAFVKAFSNEWVTFPFGDHDDALDAVFHAAVVGAGYLLEMEDVTIGEVMVADGVVLGQKPKAKINPWASFSKGR